MKKVVVLFLSLILIVGLSMPTFAFAQKQKDLSRGNGLSDWNT